MVKVKPAHAAIPPSQPARLIPIAMPNWLLEGPGSSWLNAFHIRELLISNPSQSIDIRISKITNMRSGTSERGEPQF